jgi:hypothetical protein
MALKYLTSLDLNYNELQNAVLHPLLTPPAGPVEGQIYYNSGTNKVFVFDGAAWVDISGDITNIVAGEGLTGGGNSGSIILDINPDNSTLEVNADTLRVKASGITANELASTGVAAGSYGSSTQIPTFTVDTDGRLTAAGTESVSSSLSISADTGTDTVSLISGTLNFTGADGITTAVSDDNVSIQVDSTVVRTSGDQTIAGNKTFSNNVIVSGDLTVSGTTTTINTETINLADNIITLNSNATGSASESAGIEIERGDDSNVSLIWNEGTDKWQIEITPGTSQNIATEDYVTTAVGASNAANTYATTINDTAAITHNLGTKDVIIQLYDTVTNDTVIADVVRTSTTQATITFSTTPDNSIRVLVQKIG